MVLNNRPISELPFVTLPSLNLKILIDTGSSLSFVNPTIADKYFHVVTDQEPFWVKTVHGTSLAGSSTQVPFDELFKVQNLNLKFYSFAFHTRFDMLLGVENLKKIGANIDLTKSVLKTPNAEIPLLYLDLELDETHTLGARSVQQIKLIVDNVGNGDVILPYQKLGPIEIPQSLVRVKNFETYARVLNASEHTTEFKQHSPVTVEEIDPASLKSSGTSNLNNLQPKTKFDLGQLRLDHMNEEEKAAITQLITKYSDIFYQEGSPLTFSNEVKHVIRTTDEIPVYAKNYRFPEIHLEELDKQMQELLDQGIVRNSQSPWNAPIWIVPRKMDHSGKPKFRVVVDYRKLNEKTVEDKYPLPQISELLDKLGRCQYFSTIDLKSSFHQIEMDPESIAKTAFSTPTRHLEWTRVPFGLKNAPSTFQRVMDNILRGVASEQCCTYLDDIIVFSTSLAEHIQRLEAVFKRLRSANLKIQLDKTDFLKREVAYLGHIVTPEGVRPNPDKIAAIKNFPIPKTSKEIKGFLGLLGYYRKFIKDFAKLTKPMTRCLKKNSTIDIENPEYRHCFEMCKTLLSNDPILQYPDFAKPFRLTTDASNFALGAVLSQISGSDDLPIAYASRTLNESEQKYSPIEKELLAIVWAVGYFRPYLYGRRFTIYSDHRPLQWLFSHKEPSSRLFAWKTKLQAYDFEIIYKKGALNTNADALSRIKITEETPNPTPNFNKLDNKLATRRSSLADSEIANVDSEEEGDSSNSTISTSKQTVHSNFLGNTVAQIPIRDQPINVSTNQIVLLVTKHPQSEPVKITTLFGNKTRMTVRLREIDFENQVVKFIKEFIHPKVKYGIYFETDIYSRFAKIVQSHFNSSEIDITKYTKRLIDVQSESEQKDLISKYHESVTNHRGIDETYEKLKRQYYWPNLKISIQKIINNCETCLKAKYERSPLKLKYNITPTSSRPLETLHIDKFTIENTKFLTIICTFSKYAQAYQLSASTGIEIVNGLLKFFAHHGIPNKIVSDNGTEFQNALVKELMSLHKIDIHFVASQHPESNGLAERFHSTLIEHVRILSSRKEFKTADTRSKVNYAVLAYNNSIHSVSKLTPFELLYGHLNLKSLIDLDIEKTLAHDYLAQHKEKVQALYSRVADEIHCQKEKVMEVKNTNRSDPPEIPTEVFVKTIQRQSKTKPKYNLEDVKVVDPIMKTIQIRPRHHNTKDKAHLSNIKTPRKFYETKIQNAWNTDLPESETLSHKFGLKITRQNLITLKPGEWLDDNIVNFYMELIDERSRAKPELPSTFCFNSFLYPMFKAKGFESVRNFTRRSDIFSKTLILIPIYQNNHWSLVLVDTAEKQISYFDSMSETQKKNANAHQYVVEIVDQIQSYLAFEFLQKRGVLLDSENWKTIHILTIPQQTNNDDCGVFMCQFAKLLSCKQPLNFSSADIPRLREQMCSEILKGTLL